MKRRSSLVIVVALAAAVCLGVVFMLRGRDAVEATRAAVIEAEQPSASEPAEPVEPAAPAPPSSRAAAPVAIERDPAPASIAEPAPAPQPVEFSGRLIALDADGVELPPADGKFVLIGWHGNTVSSVDVSVSAGQWSAQLPAGEPIGFVSVREALVGDVAVVVESPREDLKLAAQPTFDVRVRFARRSVLWVRSGVDGANLADVQVVTCEQFPDDNATHPGRGFSDRVLGSHLLSPIDVDALLASNVRRESYAVLVGCSGFAWARVTVDLGHGGERMVTLVRSGALEIALAGADPPSRAELRLRAPEAESRPIVSLPITNATEVQLGGLAPGDYWIRGEVGEWYHDPLVLGAVGVHIDAEATTRVTLELAPAPSVEFARAAGSLYVPEAWQLDRALVVLDLLDTPLAGFDHRHSVPAAKKASDRAGFRRFDWSLDRMQAGRYELGLFAPPFSMAIELPPGGRTDFVLEVPAPVEVAVRIVDAATGDDVDVENLHWNCLRPPGVTGGGVELVGRNTQTLRYEFRAPSTKIELSTWDLRFSTVHEVVDVTGPRFEHTLRVVPACGLVLKLVDGETAVPIPSDWQGAPQAVGGDGRCGLTAFDPLGRRYGVTLPGVYSLEIPTIAGYKPHAAETVVVPASTFVDLVVQLEREHP